METLGVRRVWGSRVLSPPRATPTPSLSFSAGNQSSSPPSAPRPGAWAYRPPCTAPSLSFPGQLGCGPSLECGRAPSPAGDARLRLPSGLAPCAQVGREGPLRRKRAPSAWLLSLAPARLRPPGREGHWEMEETPLPSRLGSSWGAPVTRPRCSFLRSGSVSLGAPPSGCAPQARTNLSFPPETDQIGPRL